MYGMGVAVGDYDNDGRDDVYITALEGDRLFHNEGDGKFRDVTTASGIRNANFGDQRRLARLRPRRQARPVRRELRPVDAEGRPVVLARRRDEIVLHAGILQGHVVEAVPQSRRRQVRGRVGRRPGVGDPTSKSLGITVFDYNSDGWPDLFVANDTQPNKLYRNNRNGTFTEEAIAAGVAYGEDGVARGAMGVDAGDYDRSGPRRICWSATSRTRCSGSITTRATSCSWTRRRAPRWGAPAC